MYIDMKPIDLLIPELFATDGGIQRYSLTLIRALRVIRPSTSLRVFIQNDFPHHVPSSGWPGIAWFPAQCSRKRLLQSLVLSAFQRRPQLLLSTHPNFAPIQYLHHIFTGSPSWCSAHGIEVWQLQHGLKRLALAHLQRLLPVSRFTASQLQLQLGDACPPLGLLFNSFDQRRFFPDRPPIELLQRYNLRIGQPVIFTLSRLSKDDSYKNIDKLIEAMPELLAEFPDLILIIAGAGNDQSRLKCLTKQLGLSRHVNFVGRISEGELPDHHRLASVFALPSTGEGFGIVFLEALGCGKPVLAGNCDGSADPLADGRFGLLVDPRLPLAAPLATLLRHEGNSLWFQSEALSQEVNKAFGFDAFCDCLDVQLGAIGR
ncbi:glycosyltransferase family 4 protein [Synechococcus sp. AH-736-G20]|nr:glycosyltransferase family 4 protein [Synechococcus sp. AH-736-G20]